MNKYGLAMGLVAAAAITGCLDPNYRSKRHHEAGNMPAAPTTNVAATPVSDGYDTTPQDVQGTTPVATATVTDEVSSSSSGAKVIDATPSNYSGTTPVAATTEPVPSNVTPAATTAAAATTTYIVQPGDTLSKISKRYNIKLDAIRAANPQVKNDVIKVGRAITLPGSVDVGEQVAPAVAAPAVSTSSVKPYTGATQQHVVKSGESLGGIARKYKTTSSQLMQMNPRIKSANSIQAGWSLTVPATAAAAAAPAVPVTEAKPAAAKDEAPVQPAEDSKDDDIAAATANTTVPVAEPAPAPAGSGDYFLYTVKPGEDITGIAINYDVPTSEILRLNGLAEGAQLTPGMEIKVPTAQ